MKANSTCLAWYSATGQISSFDASDHECDFEVATRKVAYTLPRVGRPGNDVGQKEHIHRDHYRYHHKSDREDVQEGDYYLYQYYRI